VSLISDEERKALLDHHHRVMADGEARARRDRIESLARDLFVQALVRVSTPDVEHLAARCFEHAEAFEQVAGMWRSRS